MLKFGNALQVLAGSAPSIGDSNTNIDKLVKNPMFKPFVDKLGPLIGLGLWATVLGFAILYVYKTTISIIKYFNVEEGNIKDQKDAKNAMLKNLGGLMAIVLAGVIIFAITSFMGLGSVLNSFFTL